MIRVKTDGEKILYKSTKKEISKEEADIIIRNLLNCFDVTHKRTEGTNLLLTVGGNLVVIEDAHNFVDLKDAEDLYKYFKSEITEIIKAKAKKYQIVKLVVSTAFISIALTGSLSIDKSLEIDNNDINVQRIHMARTELNNPNYLEEVVSPINYEKENLVRYLSSELLLDNVEIDDNNKSKFEIANEIYSIHLNKYGYNVNKPSNTLNNIDEVEAKLLEYFDLLDINDPELKNMIISIARLETTWGQNENRMQGNNFGGHRSLDDKGNWYFRKYETVDAGIFAHIECVVRLYKQTIDKVIKNPNDNLENYNSTINIIVKSYCPEEEEHWIYLMNDITKKTADDYGFLMNGEVNGKGNSK